jgi:undecaprenyl-diphosphatase
MIELLQAIILSIVQGITEWLPVSSSGHLAIFQNFFGFQNLAFDVFLHFASIFAVIIVFWKDIIKLFNLKEKENLRYIGLLIIGIIPAGIIGILFRHQIESLFSNLLYLGIFFMLSGILIYSTKFFKATKEKPNLLDSIFIGIFQAVAILPGISRSGATISSGLFRGLKKEEAVKFSFFMAIPVILGAALVELKDIAISQISYSMMALSFIITLLVSLFVIKLLIRIIKNGKFYLFGIYDFILGMLVLIFSFIY